MNFRFSLNWSGLTATSCQTPLRTASTDSIETWKCSVNCKSGGEVKLVVQYSASLPALSFSPDNRASQISKLDWQGSPLKSPANPVFKRVPRSKGILSKCCQPVRSCLTRFLPLKVPPSVYLSGFQGIFACEIFCQPSFDKIDKPPLSDSQAKKPPQIRRFFALQHGLKPSWFNFRCHGRSKPQNIFLH